MNNNNIFFKKMNKIFHEDGNIFHIYKESIAEFNFKEIYASTIKSKALKGWKKHTKMTMRLFVPSGNVTFQFYDEFGHSTVECVGEDRYGYLTVKPGIWFAFRGSSDASSIILNLADIEHSEGEVQRLPINSFKLTI